MILSGILFLPMEDVATDQKHTHGGDTRPHLFWLLSKIRNPSRKQLGPLLFLLLQWAIPMRMPIVSFLESKYTFEGYRWSWTMMLHTKITLAGPGLFFMTLRPKCGPNVFPSPAAAMNPFLDLNGAGFEAEIANSPRSAALVQMFPRQMPKVAHSVQKYMMGKACPPEELSMTASYFASTNNGPYHRLIDPTVNLMDVYEAHAKMPYLSKLWHAIIDKAPPGKEFVFRGAGSIAVDYTLDKDKKDELILVDRSHCLQIDPIKIHSNEFDIEFMSDSPTDFRLKVMGCPETDPVKAETAKCHDIYLERGEKRHLTPMRTISIGIDTRRNLEPPGNCSNTTREDVIIKLSNIVPYGIMQQQQPPQMQQQQQQQGRKQRQQQGP